MSQPTNLPTPIPVPELDRPQLAAIYARVSTKDQADHGASLEVQVQSCTEAAKGRGHVVLPEHIYIDPGHSGKTLARPALDKLRDVLPTKIISEASCSRLAASRLEHQS